LNIISLLGGCEALVSDPCFLWLSVNVLTLHRKAEDKFKEVPPEKWLGDNLIIRDPDAEDDALEIEESTFGDESDSDGD
jgi:hypothetical protein